MLGKVYKEQSSSCACIIAGGGEAKVATTRSPFHPSGKCHLFGHISFVCMHGTGLEVGYASGTVQDPIH